MPIRDLLLLAALGVGASHAMPAAAAAAGDPCARPTGINHLVADATRTGVIGLRFYDHHGARVTFFECVGRRPVRLGSDRVEPDPKINAPAALPDATTWSCDRLVRRFTAVATLPDGTLATGAYNVRTVSCAQRFELRVPRRVTPGRTVAVRILDRWGIGGIRPRLCVAPAHRTPDCTTLRLPRAVSLATKRVRATRPGRWNVELRVGEYRTRSAFLAGRGKLARHDRPPTVLATGDSTMQGIDSFLSDELDPTATVTSDVQPGSGISRTNYWTRHARAQTERLRQRVTLISIGAASDAMPLPIYNGQTVECCGEPWIAAYSRRAREMMLTYLRGGRARVFWLTPPLPRYAPRAVITTAVNAAVGRAAAGLTGVAHVRIDRFFSPSGYTDTIRYRGHDIPVRESDGIHLNITGTSIAASVLAPAVRDALAQTSR